MSSEVIISPPDLREGHEDIYDDVKEEINIFWSKMMNKYGNEEKYNETIINNFNDERHPELLIVVDKLITGFDSPCNTVLYITRSLKDHTLLQAIARVNRLFEGKEFGYILDYYGVLGNLDKALTEYSALADFDEDDIQGTLTNVMNEVEKLPGRHSNLWDIFKTIKNKSDEEEYELYLSDEIIRFDFYERLSIYARTLAIALSVDRFHKDTPDEDIKTYKDDLKFFENLRRAIKQRYAEIVDYKEYEKKIQKLIDTYISADEIKQITPLVNIFDEEAFKKEVDSLKSIKSKADTIAHRTKKTIQVKMGEDPAFYTKFSKLLKKTIEDFLTQRITDAEYLQTVQEIMNKVREHKDESIPDEIQNNASAKAYYGIILTTLNDGNYDETQVNELAVQSSIKIDQIITENIVVDWIQKMEIHNKIWNDIEDYFVEIGKERNFTISYNDLDIIIEQAIEVAKHRHN